MYWDNMGYYGRQRNMSRNETDRTDSSLGLVKVNEWCIIPYFCLKIRILRQNTHQKSINSFKNKFQAGYEDFLSTAHVDMFHASLALKIDTI